MPALVALQSFLDTLAEVLVTQKAPGGFAPAVGTPHALRRRGRNASMFAPSTNRLPAATRMSRRSTEVPTRHSMSSSSALESSSDCGVNDVVGCGLFLDMLDDLANGIHYDKVVC